MPDQPTMQQLMDVITQQQSQIAKLIDVQQQGNQRTNATNSTVPSLPDIVIFEPSDEKNRIAEWLDRFAFAIDCAAPNVQDAIKVKALMNKLSGLASSSRRLLLKICSTTLWPG
ncbi:hypothetical protein GPALN_015567 [Globodera pallida]|nr:hypothetical protein GPALN_015567 [Globodera pallida]